MMTGFVQYIKVGPKASMEDMTFCTVPIHIGHERSSAFIPEARLLRLLL